MPGPADPRGEAGIIGWAPASGTALAEWVALAIPLKDVDMLGDAVETPAGEGRVPFLDGQG